jgi:hypothetical protein
VPQIGTWRHTVVAAVKQCCRHALTRTWIVWPWWSMIWIAACRRQTVHSPDFRRVGGVGVGRSEIADRWAL